MTGVYDLIEDIKDFHMNPYTRFTLEEPERKERKMKEMK